MYTNFDILHQDRHTLKPVFAKSVCKKKIGAYFQERLLFQIAAYYPPKSYKRIITAYFQNNKLLSIDCEMFVFKVRYLGKHL